MQSNDGLHLSPQGSWVSMPRGPCGEAKDDESTAEPGQAPGSFEFIASLAELAEAGLDGPNRNINQKKKCRVRARIEKEELLLTLENEKRLRKPSCCCCCCCCCFPPYLSRMLKLRRDEDDMQEPAISGRGDGDAPPVWRIALPTISSVGLWHSVSSFNRGVLFQVILDLTGSDSREKQLKLCCYEGDIATMFAEALDAARQQHPEGPTSGDHRWDFQIDIDDSVKEQQQKEQQQQQQQQQTNSLSFQKPMTLQEQLQRPLASLPSPVAPRGSTSATTGILAAITSSTASTSSSRNSSRLPPIELPRISHQRQEAELLRDCGFRDCSPSGPRAAPVPQHPDGPRNPLVVSGGGVSPSTGSRQFMPGALPSPQASPTIQVVPDGGNEDTSALQKEKSEIFSFSALGWGSPADLDDTLPLMGTMPQAKQQQQQQQSVELQGRRSGSLKMKRMSSASGDEGEISFAYDIEASSVTALSPRQQQGNLQHVALMNDQLLKAQAAEYLMASPHRYGLDAEESDLGASSLGGSLRPQTGNSSLPPLMDAEGEGPLTQQQQQQQQQMSRLSAAGDVLAQREANGMSYDMSALMGSLEDGDEDEDEEYSDFVDPGESASGTMGRRHQFHSLSLSSDNDF